MTASIALVLLLAGSEANAAGMRIASTELSTKVPLVDLEQCLVRQIGRGGRATVIDIADGRAVDMSLGGRGSNIMTFEIHEAGDVRRVTAKYRHPFSDKTAVGFLNDVARQCFPEQGAGK